METSSVGTSYQTQSYQAQRANQNDQGEDEGNHKHKPPTSGGDNNDQGEDQVVISNQARLLFAMYSPKEGTGDPLALFKLTTPKYAQRAIFDSLDGKIENAEDVAAKLCSMLTGSSMTIGGMLDKPEDPETRAADREAAVKLAEHIASNYLNAEEAEEFLEKFHQMAEAQEMKDKGYQPNIKCDFFSGDWVVSETARYLVGGTLRDFAIDNLGFAEEDLPVDALTYNKVYKAYTEYKESGTEPKMCTDDELYEWTNAKLDKIAEGSKEADNSQVTEDGKWRTARDYSLEKEKIAQSFIESARALVSGFSIADLLAKYNINLKAA